MYAEQSQAGGKEETGKSSKRKTETPLVKATLPGKPPNILKTVSYYPAFPTNSFCEQTGHNVTAVLSTVPRDFFGTFQPCPEKEQLVLRGHRSSTPGSKNYPEMLLSTATQTRML